MTNNNGSQSSCFIGVTSIEKNPLGVGKFGSISLFALQENIVSGKLVTA